MGKAPGTLRSMTGYSTIQGRADGLDWIWEARSVNARGLDIRVRVPDIGEGIEAEIRKCAPRYLSRGNVSVSLRSSAMETEESFSINQDGLKAVLAAARHVGEAAMDAGVDTTPMGIGDLLTQRGVADHSRLSDRIKAHIGPISEGIPALFEALAEARAKEGAALAEILERQLGEVARLIDAAETVAEARAAKAGTLLRSRVEALLDHADTLDETRLEQELALLAVKLDVTEELDRLRAHIENARSLLQSGGPIGRKLDFLMQEFNREANTLCSKSNSVELTRIGLDLKVVIDQMREQSANVE